MSQLDKGEAARNEAFLKGALRLGETDDFTAGLQILIETVCEASGWLYGQAWVAGDEGEYLMLSPAWHAVPGTFAEMRKSFEKEAFRRPGSRAVEAFDSGMPAHHLDLGDRSTVVSLGSSGTATLTSAIYLPLTSGDRPIAVLEFFASGTSSDEATTKQINENIKPLTAALIKKRNLQSDREVAERFRDLVEGVADYAIFMLDTQGLVASWNAGAERMMGYQPSEIMGRDFSVFYPQESLPKDPTDDLKRAAMDGRLENEGWRVRKDGSRFIAHVLVTPMFDGAGQVSGYSQVIRDITERRLAEDRLEHLALHDDLTGLSNRTLFVDRLGQALARIGRTARLLAVMFFDLDDFKKINDTLGHDVGDEVLKAVGDRLRGAVRPQDTIARFGGDEFVVLCEDLGNIDEVTTIAERLIDQISDPVVVDEREVPVALSMGIALAKSPGESRLGLLQDADAAMYRAKSKGRGGFEFFDDEMREQVKRRRAIERDIHRAFSDQEMVLHHQPVIDIASGKVAGFEGLIRWNHPDRGVIGPGEFYELAEESGLALLLAEWVIADACRWLSSSGRHFVTGPLPFISVNLTERQLGHAGLPEIALATMERFGLAPGQLLLEVRESSSDEADAERSMRELRSAGLPVVLDRVGSVDVSARRLAKMPVDVIKITGGLVSGLGSDPSTSKVTSAVIDLAHALGQKVIAHAVEKQIQLDELSRLGCDMAQGHLLGMPSADA